MEDAIPPSAPPPPPPAFTPPPPVIFPRPPPPPAERGRGWMTFAIVLIFLLGLRVLMNFSQLAGSVMQPRGGGPVARQRYAGPRLEEATVEDNSSSAKIALVDVDGIIKS